MEPLVLLGLRGQEESVVAKTWSALWLYLGEMGAVALSRGM